MSALQKGLDYEQYVYEIWQWQNIPKDVLLELKFINNLEENCDDIGCDI